MEPTPFQTLSAFAPKPAVAPPPSRKSTTTDDDGEPTVAKVPLAQVEDWYRRLDQIAIDLVSPGRVTTSRNSTDAEALHDLRDEVYAYLRG